MAATAACIICFFGGSDWSAYAQTESITLDLPVDGQVTYRNLIAQAELMVSNTINRQFTQNPGLSTIQVVVVGDRHGEVIPVLTTTVSRAQWQENSQVNAWTQYYRASYALLQRHEQEERVAVAPARSVSSANIQNRRSDIYEAYDGGFLTGEVAQDYLSDLD